MSSIVSTVPLRSDIDSTMGRELRHGLIPPPTAVRQRVEEERTKHPPEIFAKNEPRLLNDWTIGYLCQDLCAEVVYRRTPAGPEVIAIGTDEVIAWRKSTPLAEQMHFETFLGY